MKIILFDPHPVRENLLPLTYTRPVADMRLGITTIAEKWQALLPGSYSWQTEDYLAELFPPCAAPSGDAIFVAGNVVPDAGLASAVASLGPDEALWCDDTLVARRGDGAQRCDYAGPAPLVVSHIYDIFLLNGAALRADFDRLTAGRTSQPLSDTVMVIGPRDRVFIEEGAWVEGCILNTTVGPVYIGRGATVMEGSMLRGPIAVCDHATVNMGTKIYPDTTVGPWCKVGGELNNAVIHSYSNKAHDGFLGNAVIGSWCNLGAGCVASNLKNSYDLIRLWNYPAHRFLRTDLQFCGLIMGDHSKAGINTMFNTATVVGVGCNIHGAGMPRPFVPSFSEGGPVAGFSEVDLNHFFLTAERVMARRHVDFTDAHRRVLLAIHSAADGL